MGLFDWISERWKKPANGEKSTPNTAPSTGSVEQTQSDRAEARKKRKKAANKPSRKQRLQEAGMLPEQPKPRQKKGKKKRKNLHVGGLDQPPPPPPARRQQQPEPKAAQPEVQPSPPAEVSPEPVPAAPQPQTVTPSADRPRREGRASAEEQTRAWFVLPRLQALLDETASRFEQVKDDHSKLKSLLKNMERQWNQLGPVPKDQTTLLARHDELHSSMVARLAALPDPVQVEEFRIVAERQSLIAQAEALLQIEDASESAKQFKALQRVWRQSGRLPQAIHRDLQRQWTAAHNAIQGRQQAMWDERREKREGLIRQAELLVGSRDPQKAAEAYKGLQARWKKVGGLPRREGDALWKRFRSIGDAVFEERNAAREAVYDANREAKETLIAQVNVLAQNGVEDARDVRAQLMRQWKRIGHTRRADADRLWNAFRAACDRLDKSTEPDSEIDLSATESLRFKAFAGLSVEE